MNNRQAGRRRGRGGQRQGGSPGRSDTGNRIDNRARGNAAQLLEKYKNLAADAQRSGDRVNTEYYLQFADHYFRVLAENRSRAEENGQARRPRDDESFDDEGEEYGFEGDIVTPAYQQQPAPVASEREDRPRRPRDEGEERPRRAREEGEERPRRIREDGEERQPRAEREPRARREREAAPETGEERPRREPRSYVRDAEGDTRGERPEPANDEPRRRGRPRREAPVEAAATEGLDAAVLPPAIAIDAPAAEEAPVERPRRGRPRRVRSDEGEAVPPAA